VKSYCLSHLSDPALVRDLTALVARDRATTAALLAHLAEVDERKLYLPDAHPSMYSWCVGVLGFSEESAHKRIRVARVARRFPAIFQAIADGSLNLSLVSLLAPYLTLENAAELIQEAGGRTRAEVEELLARRFPRSESLPMVVAISGVPARPGEDQRSPGTVQVSTPLSGCRRGGQSGAASEGPRVAPIAEERYELRLSLGKETIEDLRRAEALMSHTLPAGAVDQVIALALKSLVKELERRKFAATSRPRQAPGRASDDPRHIPAERAFGAGFMKEKRARARAAARGRVAEGVPATKVNPAVEEVIPWLRQLGWRADESRIAAAACAAILDAPLEERVRVALACAGRNRFPRAFGRR